MAGTQSIGNYGLSVFRALGLGIRTPDLPSLRYTDDILFYTGEGMYIIYIFKFLLGAQLWRVKEIAEYLNSKNQFGIGMYLYNAQTNNINPMVEEIEKY
jgi:hypothetical protein